MLKDLKLTTNQYNYGQVRDLQGRYDCDEVELMIATHPESSPSTRRSWQRSYLPS